MFGFMRPCYCDTAYKKVYCQACRHLKLRYGRTALPFLSYEAAFLHALAADIRGGTVEQAEKCRCVTGPRDVYFTETDARQCAVGEFSAAFTMLLMAVKIQDDVRDENSQCARAVLAFYRQAILKARRFFSTLDADFDARLERFITAHHFMEEAGVSHEMMQYAAPTGQTFSWIFRLFGRFMKENLQTVAFLAEAGFWMGTAIIQADCAWDWQRDARRGEYNPVRTLDGSAAALVQAQESLRHLHTLCARRFGENSLSAKTALGVHDRLYFSVKRDTRYSRFFSQAGLYDLRPQSIHASAACPTLVLLAQHQTEPASCSQFMCSICVCCSTLSLCFGLCSPFREEENGRLPTTMVDFCYASTCCVQCREVTCGRDEY